MKTDPDKVKVFAVRFTGQTERDRYAEKVFRHYLSLPDPNDEFNPNKRMKPQYILIEALNALGQRLEQEGISLESEKNNAANLKETLSNGLDEIKALLSGFDAKIQSMQVTGILTPEQAQDVKSALDAQKITSSFSANLSKSLREGRTKT